MDIYIGNKNKQTHTRIGAVILNKETRMGTPDISIGMELRLKRTELKLSMKSVSEAIAISENYLSLIERDKQIPSDHLIREIAKYYNMDEKYLFDRFGRIPLTVAEEIRENDLLSEVLYEISSDSRLSEEQKERLYKGLKGLYHDITRE